MVFYFVISAMFVGTLAGLGWFAWWYFSDFQYRREKLDRDLVELYQLQDALRKERDTMRATVEAEIREKLKREEAEIESHFSMPVLEGRSWKETLAIVLKLLDMQRRSVPVSVRVCADNEIGRHSYELIKEAFLGAGYWVKKGEETPAWTDLGVKYLDWVYKRYRRDFDQLYSVIEA